MAHDKPSRLGRGLDVLIPKIAPRATTKTAVTENADELTPPIIPISANAEGRAAGLGQAASPYADPFPVHGSAHSPQSPSNPAADATTLPQGQTTSQHHASGLRNIPIAQIAANPFQPRKEFRADELAELEASLKASGIIQPITVRPSPHHTGFELIAGERRLRAATRLGWTEIPALVRPTDDHGMLTLAMVENLQRADLDPIDEADGYQRLVDDFQLTQQEVADVVGKDRSTIANALRLLALPASVKRMLQERHITVGHARALLPLGAERAMSDLSREIVAKTLSVRDVEERVRGARPTPARTGRKTKTSTNNGAGSGGTRSTTAEARRVEELLRKRMQTAVSLHMTAKEKGEVRIAFYSNDDLERVLALLGVNLDS